MKTRNRLARAALACALFVVIAGCSRSKASKPGIEGHWTGYDVTQPETKCEITITGNRLEYLGGISNDWARGTFVLNEAKQPMQMDLTLQEAPPGNAPNPIPIIYERKDDEMRVAVSRNGKRPVDFIPRVQVRVFALKKSGASP